MFVITNRSVDEPATGLDQFGKTPNEDDNNFTLRLSRIKHGDAQRARLGHYIKRIESRTAHYINLTDALGTRIALTVRRTGGQEQKAEDLLSGTVHRSAGRGAAAVSGRGKLV